jgi:hypothetical protein
VAPAVSADGRAVVYTRANSWLTKPSGAASLYTVGIDGSANRRVTPWKLGGGDHPTFSPSVRGNVAVGSGPSGVAQGGGIWNGSLDPSSSLGPLRLIDSTIAQNALNVTAGITAQGGGIFTITKPTIRHTTFAHNKPDHCHGC